MSIDETLKFIRETEEYHWRQKGYKLPDLSTQFAGHRG